MRHSRSIRIRPELEDNDDIFGAKRLMVDSLSEHNIERSGRTTWVRATAAGMKLLAKFPNPMGDCLMTFARVYCLHDFFEVSRPTSKLEAAMALELNLARAALAHLVATRAIKIRGNASCRSPGGPSARRSNKD